MARGSVQIEGLNRYLRELQGLGLQLDDLKGAFSQIARKGAALAARFAPKRTGALAASIRGNRAKNKAIVYAGRARVPYAGPINYGWQARGIAPAAYMQKADEAIAPDAPGLLVQEINDAIRRRGLG